MKRMLTWVAAAIIGIIAIAGVWNAATTSTPQTVEQTAREVSRTLRCPTCAGESIADSSALLSDAMRQTVATQVAEGRTPDEIRAWFAQRYGDEVLLAPPHTGYGALLWAIPVVLIGAAATVLIVRTRRAQHVRPAPRYGMLGIAGGTVLAAAALVWLWLPQQEQSQPETVSAHEHADPETPTRAQQDSVIAVLRDGVEQAPGSLDLRLTLANALEAADFHEEAAEHYAAAARLQPLDADISYRHAFALVRSGDPEQAQQVLDHALDAEPEHAPSLLLLGVLLREDEPDRGEELLTQFAQLEPDHPATKDVLAVLEGQDVEVQP